MEKRKLDKLASLWVKGVEIEWERLYCDPRPPRLHLPLYPFARERYWSPGTAGMFPAQEARGGVPETKLHPLVHRNTSTLREHRYSSSFTGDEWVLRDHVVAGRKLLPGMAYLEMARAAVECATAEEIGSGSLRLWDITWVRPLVVDVEPVFVHVGLYEGPECIEFEVYAEEGDEEVVCAQGRADWCEPEEPASVDLELLRRRCSQGELSSQEIYWRHAQAGIEYGAAYRGVERLHIGGGEVLARLKLSADAGAESEYVLHPGLMDSALQAASGLNLGAGQEKAKRDKVGLLFAVDSVQINGCCGTEAWAWVRRHKTGASPEGSGIEKFDVEICDDSGRVQVRLRGVSTRAVDGIAEDLVAQAGCSESEALSLEPAKKEEALVGSVALAPVWEVMRDAVSRNGREEHNNASELSSVLLVGGTAEWSREWERHAGRVHWVSGEDLEEIESVLAGMGGDASLPQVVWVAPPAEIGSVADERVLECEQQGVMQVFRLLKAMLRAGYGAREVRLVAITEQSIAVHGKEAIDVRHTSVHGLLGTVAKEYRTWDVVVVDHGQGERCGVYELVQLSGDGQGSVWAYRRGEWYRQRLVWTELKEGTGKGFCQGGVYVVIGGAGGIGEVLTEYLIKCYQAQVVWIGRRAADEEIERKRERLGQLGTPPLYVQADASCVEELREAWKRIWERYGRVHGLVHSAVGAFDESIAEMEEAKFREVLSAKVDVSVRMAQVFAGQELDWVMVFSSLNSFAKDAGKAGYSAGSVFVDSFAQQLGREWSCPVKVVNWGYWGEVGAGGVVPQSTKNRLAQSGIGVIEADDGMLALEQLLGSTLSQVAYLKTTRPGAIAGVDVEEKLRQAVQQAVAFEWSEEPLMVVPELNGEQAAEMAGAYEQLLRKLLVGQLQSLGLVKGKRQSVAAWQRELGVVAGYERWLAESFRWLSETGLLELHEGEWASGGDEQDHLAQTTSEQLWEQWEAGKRRWAQDTYIGGQLSLVEATLRALPEILTGQRRATEVMFPEATVGMVGGVYRSNPISDYYHRSIAELVVRYLQQPQRSSDHEGLRILEIGAGTGATSAAVFEALQGHEKQIAEYCYTDISRAFLLHAEQAYGLRIPYLRYELLDVESEAGPQGFEQGCYDIVIAANVLHATRDIRLALRNAKSLLKRNGFLLLNEITGRSLFTHLTFGLLEGWWRFQDEGIRVPGCPALEPESWRWVLEGEGFDEVRFTAERAHRYGQQIIVAASDGLIRERVAPFKKKPVCCAVSNPQQTAIKSAEAPAKASAAAQARVSKAKAAPTKQEGRKGGEEWLREKAAAYLQRIVGETLKIPVNRIEANKPIESYGIDSILVIQLTGILRREGLAGISSTAFFEYRTLAELAGHLLTTEGAAMERLLGVEAAISEPNVREPERACGEQAQAAGISPRASARTSRQVGSRRRLRKVAPPERVIATEPVAEREGIAIIGLAGRYPQARTLEEYWAKLEEWARLHHGNPGGALVARWLLSSRSGRSNFPR